MNTFQKKFRKLSYLELDDGLQGLRVLEDVLRGLDGVADVDVGVGEVEVEVEVASSALRSKLKKLLRFVSIELINLLPE